jgi:hypothetical protein
MPVLIIQTGTPSFQKRIQAGIISEMLHVDGTLPQDVFRDFGFVTTTEGVHQSNLSKVHSIASLLSVLVDQHGWEISNVASAVKWTLVYVLIKKK